MITKTWWILTTPVFGNVNRQQIETSGVEFEAQWQPVSSLRLTTNATYTDLDVKGEDTVLTGRPEWSAGAIASWQINSRWQSSFDYRYIGRQWATSRYTGEELTERLQDYHRVDSMLQWQPARRWQWQLSLDNLLNERYETAVGFTAPKRTVRVGARYNF